MALILYSFSDCPSQADRRGDVEVNIQSDAHFDIFQLICFYQRGQSGKLTHCQQRATENRNI